MSFGDYQEMASTYRSGIINGESNEIFQDFSLAPAKRAFAFHIGIPILSKVDPSGSLSEPRMARTKVYRNVAGVNAPDSMRPCRIFKYKCVREPADSPDLK